MPTARTDEGVGLGVGKRPPDGLAAGVVDLDRVLLGPAWSGRELAVAGGAGSAGMPVQIEQHRSNAAGAVVESED